ncbi:uncharacterized protein LOC121977175 [Zingiber officinale]|uniref:Uncharacterized protein n=1 Tax=Zingiber officinale TaxID=94328 RepID=A0A8J5GQF4_ZINOF|nr:uncharacterized protein LOC121977175 [Zingiber officinale]KAG6512987.1 hypothetical protein ZIOFF_031133 [Zingiber officinale]
MQPKGRPLLSILVLVSFSSLFLLFSYRSSSSSFRSSISLSPTSNPNSRFTFIIKVLTYDRIASLRRCLRSLAAADYAGDRVHLHVLVDHFRVANGSSDSTVDSQLEESRQILDLVDRIGWPHGEKIVHYRTANVGLQAQWLEAWWPSSDDEFAFVVEDDLELSPLYYKFLKGLILKYYYDPANFDPSIYGASLQRPRFVAGKHGNRLQLDNETRIFLYQLVGTWGQLLFPKPWKEFRLWYDENKTKGIKPFLQGMVTTGWYKRFGERIWTPWFIKFIHSRGYYNIYTNFNRERALSISHRDAGVNYGKTIGPDSSLLEDEPLDFNLLELPPLRNLKWYDFCFAETFPGRVAGSFDELRSIVHSMKQNKLVVISLYQTTEKIARNLICNLEKDGLLNVVFVGGDTELLLDLARRGYGVIDSNKLISSFGHDKSMDLQHEADFVRETWVKASIIQKCLEFGYDTWLIDGNMIPNGGSLPELPNSSCNLAVAKDVELLFVKSRPSSLKIWNSEYVHKMATASKFLLANNSQLMRDESFMHLIAMTLGEKERFDHSSIGLKLGDATPKPSESKANIIFWDRQMTTASVQVELERFGMWLIDAESSCTSVVCRR